MPNPRDTRHKVAGWATIRPIQEQKRPVEIAGGTSGKARKNLADTANVWAKEDIGARIYEMARIICAELGNYPKGRKTNMPRYEEEGEMQTRIGDREISTNGISQ